MTTASLLTLIFSPANGDGVDGPSDRLGPRHARVRMQPRADADDDAVTLARVRAGDERAIGDLFRMYASDLVAFARRYVHSDDIAREIVQDVFLWVLQHHRDWTVTSTIRSYVYGATRHRVLDYLKHAAVERRWAEQGGGDIVTPVAPVWADDAVLRDERKRALAIAIDHLPESRRTTLALRYGHDLSYAEIAHILGASVKAVENQLNRTLRQLGTLLGEGHSAAE